MQNNNDQMPAKGAIKDVEVAPVEVNVNMVMPTGMAEALAAANTATKELIHTTLDRFATTTPAKAGKITRIAVVQTFSVAPDAVRLDIEIAQ